MKTIQIDRDVYDYLVSKAAPQPAPGAGPNVIEFHIAAGTGGNPWNAREQMLTARVGDTLRITNDDNVAHRLHTDGAPFPHPGSDVAPGATQDYVLQAAFDPGANRPLYDHDYGTAAAFWIKVTV